MGDGSDRELDDPGQAVSLSWPLVVSLEWLLKIGLYRAEPISGATGRRVRGAFPPARAQPRGPPRLYRASKSMAVAAAANFEQMRLMVLYGAQAAIYRSVMRTRMSVVAASLL